jgi:hypothetical protein
MQEDAFMKIADNMGLTELQSSFEGIFHDLGMTESDSKNLALGTD